MQRLKARMSMKPIGLTEICIILTILYIILHITPSQLMDHHLQWCIMILITLCLLIIQLITVHLTMDLLWLLFMKSLHQNVSLRHPVQGVAETVSSYFCPILTATDATVQACRYT